MPDVTCPACDIVYHAEETQVGHAFRCKVCGKILTVEQPSLLDLVVQSTVSKQELRRDGWWVVSGIIFGSTLLAGVWLWPPNTQPASPQVKATVNQTEPIPPADIKPLQPLKHLDESTSHHASGAVAPPPVVVTPKCAEGHSPARPATGERIEPDQEADGDSTLEITNSPISDAAIRLVDTSTNLTVRFVYIRSRDVYTVQGIQPGAYSLRYASGRDWVPACAEFTRNGSIDELPKPLAFEEGYKTTGKVTLFGVPFGNVRSKGIDKKRFLEGDQHFSFATGQTIQ